MKKTKLVALILSVLMVACVFASCSGGTKATTAPTTAPTTATTEEPVAAPTDAPAESPVVSDEVGMPNPMVEATQEKIQSDLGLTMIIPAEATEAKYFIIDGSLAEAKYKLDGINYVQRMKKTAALEDISGAYFTWGITNELKWNDYPYTIAYNEGAEGLATWYDTLSGVTYSVFMETGASEAALKAISEIVIPAE